MQHEQTRGFPSLPSRHTTIHGDHNAHPPCVADTDSWDYRLEFPAPEKFRLRLTKSLEGVEGIVNVVYDILVFGEGITCEESERARPWQTFRYSNGALQQQ